ncbi:nucleotide exchange factor GrpE [Candidatus Daviesbacteria bacterium]|nr:nucleotide exchange factor GrpE [Candidatus Daviesbacteria bacterium]
MKKQKEDNQNNTHDDVISQATKKAEVQELQEELARVKVDHEDIRNQLKRAVADYQNLEKRIQEARGELSSWANANLIIKILPVLDHFEKAIKGASEEDRESGWFRGVELALQQLQAVLADEGLEEIEIDPVSSHGTGGTRFDPSLHEAVDTKDGDDNIILEIVEKGYTLGGKVIKPAKVVVGRKELLS